MRATDFNGASVAAFESRLCVPLEQLIRKLNGKPMVAPSMQEIPLDNNPEVTVFGQRLIKGEADIIIFMTGVGTKILLDLLYRLFGAGQIKERLLKTVNVTRGPKPAKVLRDYQIPITLTVPEPNTWREIIQALESNERAVSLEGSLVAIQEYGVPSQEFVDALKKRGAHVYQIPVYRWALPDDTAPLQQTMNEIILGNIQFTLFTSGNQARNLFKMASQQGMETMLKESIKKTVIASIGPATTEALQEIGLSVDFEPSHPKMGQLVSETAASASQLLEIKRRPMSTINWVEPSVLPPPSDERSKRRQSPFMKACFRERTPYTPIWIMRQAGRYLKEYNRIRKRVSFLELCENKELAAQVTIDAVRILGVDAAIIFSDILLILKPMGLKLEYSPGDGPQILNEIDSPEAVTKIRKAEAQSLNFVYDAIRLTRANLKSDIPLIGFSGAPFTLASYAIEGGGSKDFIRTKTFMYTHPLAWHELLNKLTDSVIDYLRAQIEAGADALQIFDSWIGCLGPLDYETYVAHHMKRLFASLPSDIPVIHFGTNTAALLPQMSEAGGHVIGIDHRVNLDRAWKEVGSLKAVQGNLDPCILFSSPEVIQDRVNTILKQAAGQSGHIFNLGHGVLPGTPVDNVQGLVDCVHELSAKKMS